MKWVHLTTARGQLEAEMWRDMLVAEGVSALVHQGDTTTFLAISPYPCRIMVAQDELERAKEIMETLEERSEYRAP